MYYSIFLYFFLFVFLVVYLVITLNTTCKFFRTWHQRLTKPELYITALAATIASGSSIQQFIWFSTYLSILSVAFFAHSLFLCRVKKCRRITRQRWLAWSRSNLCFDYISMGFIMATFFIMEYFQYPVITDSCSRCMGFIISWCRS